MNQFKVLVLEDSLSDQLSIEMILSQFDGLETKYIKTASEFEYETSLNQYLLFIVDINLQETLTGIDLLKNQKNASTWAIICSAYDAQTYSNEYNRLNFNVFYHQKPIEENSFKSIISSFLLNKKQNIKL
jgi:DNA-binding response OmpR family regulator